MSIKTDFIDTFCEYVDGIDIFNYGKSYLTVI